ncbi:MAG TPA: PIG-L deacetylase family protein [Candidatus Saccharimonadales bacterium]|nr:PIG-L deacetylase family protein [Candidatus Saccharimonadales bacterium]
MRKTIACVFAHPDDEAFGPSGTIAQLAKDNDVYILCATKGEAGENSLQASEKLAHIREKELLESAKILGVKKVYFLGFKDGTLSNNLYHKLASKIQGILEKLKPEMIITVEMRGVSGHIDHITVSMVTSFVFEKLPFIKTIMYSCISDKRREFFKDYFIFVPPGYKKSEIDKVVDITDVWDLKVKAMRTHKSQSADAERILREIKDLPKEEYFLVTEK